MSESVQHVQQNPSDSVATQMESNQDSANGQTETNQRQRRQRRYFRPEEITMAHQFKNLVPIGEPIAYADLPNIDMKLAALFTAKQYRLVERGLLEPDIDINSGQVISVRIVPEKWDEYADDLIMPETKVKSVATPGDGLRKPRNILSDPKYKIKVLKDSNPRREGSHGWHNWGLYRDGESVVDYLNFMDYDRMIVVTSRRGRKAYFNGPSLQLLMQDLKAGYVGIYDSTLAVNDSNYWLTADDVATRSNGDEEDEDDSAESANPGTLSQGAESVPATA